MDWLAASVASVVVVVLFWAPGAAFLRVIGVRGMGLIAWAPLMTLGIFGGGAVVVDALRIDWGFATGSGLALLATGCALALRGRGPGTAASALVVQPRGIRPWLTASLAAGTLAQVIPLIVGMGRPTRLLTAHDIAFHINAVERVRSKGSASSLTLLGVNRLDDADQGFYGAAWHAVMSLAPEGLDAGILFNVGAFLPAALAWTTGLVVLTQRVFPRRPRTWCWAALLSASGIATPYLLVLRPEGMVPNSMAVSLVPALVALCAGRVGLRRRSWWAVMGLGVVGIGLTHPNALIAAALVLTPWVLRSTREQWHAATSTPRRSAATATGLAGVIVVLGVIVTRPQMKFVVSYPQESPFAWWEALATLASGNTTGMGWASGLLVMLAALQGGVLARRLPAARPLVHGALVMVALYLLSTSSIPILTEVDRPWYGEPRRFAPVLAAVVVPLAALAVDSWPRWLVASGRLRTSLSSETVGLVLGMGLVVISSVPAGWGAALLARHTFVVSADNAGVADDEERAMMARASARLDPHGAVLGSAFSGAAHLHAVAGARVVLRTALSTDDPDLALIRDRLPSLGADAEVCAALNRLHIRYLYVDARPWNTIPEHIDLLEPPARGVRLVDEGGGAAIYEVTACG